MTIAAAGVGGNPDLIQADNRAALFTCQGLLRVRLRARTSTRRPRFDEIRCVARRAYLIRCGCTTIDVSLGNRVRGRCLGPRGAHALCGTL